MGNCSDKDRSAEPIDSKNTVKVSLTSTTGDSKHYEKRESNVNALKELEELDKNGHFDTVPYNSEKGSQVVESHHVEVTKTTTTYSSGNSPKVTKTSYSVSKDSPKEKKHTAYADF
jgi:hypothetical protein